MSVTTHQTFAKGPTTPLGRPQNALAYDVIEPTHTLNFLIFESMKLESIHSFLTICLLFPLLQAQQGLAQATFPDGFNDELITEDLLAPVGIAFPDSHLMYVWEQNGRIHVLEDGRKLDVPLLDLQAEVSAAGDHGMLGMTLDPDFAKNGYLYASYVVDPHYLRYFGTPQYDPANTDSWNATIGRVTRFQVNVNNFTETLPQSRKVLLGTDMTNGIPVLAPAHGVGGLDFGTDGSLLIGSGDGTTWVGHYTGGAQYREFGYDSLGKVLGIIDDRQDVGSLRAQQIESYSGKILRIDPVTGLGLSSNPFYDPSAPNAARSKVWALGLRSPFRIRVRPGSGSIDPDDGRPGVLYIGDVGSNQYEELNIAGEPGRNFGWPLYEGMEVNRGYYDQWIENPYAENTQVQGCDMLLYRFNDLLVQPSKDHSLQVVHPCDPNANIQVDHPVFIHERPTFAYGNSINNPEQTYVGAFSTNGEASSLPINDPRSSVISTPFDGISSVVGDFYMGQRFPESYRQAYFHADFSGWIKSISYDTHNVDEIHSIQSFKEGGFYVVYVGYNPFDQALYYVVLDYSTRPNVYQLRKIFYGGNAKPIARITSDLHFGAAPLTVHISAEESFDPAGEPISYLWSWAGLQTSKKDTTLVFETIDDTPQNDTIKLLVRDTSGLIDSTYQVISLNNSPPVVKITSIIDQDLYPLDQGLFTIPLLAKVTDEEHDPDLLQYNWEIKLNHNDHFHVEHVDTNDSTSITLFPLGSTALDKHAYVISLTVTDPLGLSSFDAVTIHPDLATNLITSASKDLIFTYPNPVQDHLTIVMDGALGGLRYSMDIFNLLGQRQMSAIIDPRASASTYDLHALPAGTYVLVLKEHNRMIDVRKIIKK